MFKLRVDGRTALSMVELRDAQELFALTDSSRNHLREWLPWVDNVQNPSDTTNFIQAALERHAQNNGFQCCIRYDGKIAGVIGFHRIDWANRSTEIGYWLGQQYQGRGIMTNCCRVLIDYAFTEFEINRVEIRVAVGNAKSKAIPQRLGFVQEGILRDAEWLYNHFVDSAVYSVLQREWKARQNPE